MVTTATASASSLVQLDEAYRKLKAFLHEKHKNSQVWLALHGAEIADLKDKTQNLAAAAGMLGSVMVAKPVDTQVMEQMQALGAETQDETLTQVTAEERQAVLDKMKTQVQVPAGHLPPEEQLYLEQQLSDMLGFPVVAQLDGHKLNHSIGIMGGEQHLRRYPNDDISQHDAYRESGMAPNRGAFGWFTDQGQLTPEAVLREKYYFAVQTLYLPDWNTNHAELKPWYKFRKMIMINPADEVAVVGVVGDAGPALWVQKQFGGSPEVIREGKVWSKQARGHVMLFFVDDPNNQVPLGPISLSAAQELLASN